MKLLTKAIETRLKANSIKSLGVGSADFQRTVKPVVKLFNPSGGATWLISEMDDNGIMFGLCDLGMGSPELGYVALQELEEVRGAFGLGIERDIHWEADKSLIEYSNEAIENQYIKA